MPHVNTAQRSIIFPSSLLYHWNFNTKFEHNKILFGDRLDNDIVPANKIGMKTVWIKQGFGRLATPMTQEEQPKYTVSNLNELCALEDIL